MIFVALGSNLASPRFGDSQATLEAALSRIAKTEGFRLLRRSRWYQSPAWPPSDQPNFVNGVAEVASELAPDQVMGALHDIEVAFGRTRKRVNEARILDLDLLTYHDLVSEEGAWPLLPHPRMAERAFVLRPLAEVAPQWRHPVLGETAAVLLSRLDAPQVAEPLD